MLEKAGEVIGLYRADPRHLIVTRLRVVRRDASLGDVAEVQRRATPVTVSEPRLVERHVEVARARVLELD